MVAILLCVFDLITILAVGMAFGQGNHNLGPGRGEWTVETPESHGLSSSALEVAAKRIGVLANERYCLTVVKDGVIVHETYYANTSSSIYETDSLGKTATAALVGLMVEEGVLDIDKPIREYGVSPDLAVWNATGRDFFEQVTMRHLLAQSSGYGTVPPGSKMTYDSDKYIQYISYTITAIAKSMGMKGAYEYAKTKFAVPLGIPTVYDYDGTGIDISAGGGQMMSCRDIARVGQLILNNGKWLDEKNQPYQMSSSTYLAQLTQPAFPGIIDGYGLLTWLNTDMSKAATDGTKRAHCCAPRWANGRGTNPPGVPYATCCEAASNYSAHSIPCDTQLPVLPERPCAESPTPTCVHSCDPSEYVVTQNLGDSFPYPDKISASENIGFGMGQYAKYIYLDPERNITVSTFGQSTGHSLDCEGGYNDGYTLSLIWKELEPVFANPVRESKPTPKNSRSASLIGRSNRNGGDLTHATVEAAAKAAAQGKSDDEFVGSCSCTCPPGEGFGKCFNIPKSDVLFPPKSGQPCPLTVKAKLPPAYDWCPAIGFPTQCDPSQVGTNVCDNSKYDTVQLCQFVGNSTTLASAGCRSRISKQWISYGPGCMWSEQQCQPTPFFPPPYDL